MDVIIGCVLGLSVLIVFALKFYLSSSVTCPCKNRLDGKIVIITGASAGIGKATATECGRRGATVILACRNRTLGEATATLLRNKTQNENIHFLLLDLASVKSVREFVMAFVKQFGHLDVLINNAGYLGPKARTPDGMDWTFVVNYLNHFLMTNLLLTQLKLDGSSQLKIINLTSDSYKRGGIEFDDMMWDKRRPFDMYAAYGQSKLAMLMFTAELSYRFCDKGVISFAVHPGAVKTSLQRHWPGLPGQLIRFAAKVLFRTPAAGAQTVIYCAVADDLDAGAGKLYYDCRPIPIVGRGKNYQDAERLWGVSWDLCELSPHKPI